MYHANLFGFEVVSPQKTLNLLALISSSHDAFATPLRSRPLRGEALLSRCALVP